MKPKILNDFTSLEMVEGSLDIILPISLLNWLEAETTTLV